MDNDSAIAKASTTMKAKPTKVKTQCVQVPRKMDQICMRCITCMVAACFPVCIIRPSRRSQLPSSLDLNDGDMVLTDFSPAVGHFTCFLIDLFHHDASPVDAVLFVALFMDTAPSY
ncbi:hypothetical protein BDR04DRAFT_1151478 [Suillus decipiens]|nr:hypothetical protein BDR04DRAFT_1151478 [Suillus decipiens]